MQKGTQTLRAKSIKSWEIDLKYLRNMHDIKECLYINYAQQSSFQRPRFALFPFEISAPPSYIK
jgi:hypothetical protein